MTATGTNTELYRRLIDAFNQDDLDAVDDIVSDDVVVHEAGQHGLLRGPEGVKEFFRTYRTAFPDAHIEIDEILSEGDVVAARWTGTGTHDGELMGIEPTGRDVSVMGMEMYRGRDGELVEGWGVFDLVGMLQQVGVLPEDVSAAARPADD